MNDTAARADILARIQAANSAGDAVTPPADDAWQQLGREYARQGTMSPEARTALFEERLLDYGAQVFRTTLEGLPAAIERTLDRRRKSTVLVPEGLPKAWLGADISFRTDDALDTRALDSYEGVLTSATVGIAATGTIVLQNAAGQGRRALSLVPDHHLCVIFADQVVETVAEAFARLAPTCTLPTTFISGPSATADIEMTRIQGVHGPRSMDVILVE